MTWVLTSKGAADVQLSYQACVSHCGKDGISLSTGFYLRRESGERQDKFRLNAVRVSRCLCRAPRRPRLTDGGPFDVGPSRDGVESLATFTDVDAYYTDDCRFCMSAINRMINARSRSIYRLSHQRGRPV